MMEIRAKDKVFLAVGLPIALIGAYVGLVAMPTVKRIAALQVQHRTLPDVDMFPTTKRALERQVAEAEKELAAERAVKPSELSVKGDPAATVAARQEAALAKFTAVGVKVVRVQPLAEGTTSGGTRSVASASDARGRSVLAATGRCPAPEARVFTVEADYAAFVAALDAFAKDQAAVIPESISLRVGGRTCRWEMTLWL